MNKETRGGKRAGAGRPKSIIKIVEDTDFSNLKPRELKRIAQLIVDNVEKEVESIGTSSRVPTYTAEDNDPFNE